MHSPPPQLSRPEEHLSLSICIATSGRWELLKRCLQSIKNQDYPNDFVEILLPVQKKFLAKWSQPIKNFGFQNLKIILWNGQDVCEARNFGLENASHEILYFLDEDCSLPTHLHFENLNSYHQGLPQVTAIGGRYVHGELGTRFGKAYNLVCDMWQDRSDFYYEEGRLKHLVGGNLSLKMKDITKATRFGSVFDFGGEEMAFLKELENQGLKCHLVNGISVEHHAQHSVNSFFARAWLHGTHKVHLEKESFGSMYRQRSLLIQKKSSPADKGLAAAYLGFVQMAYLKEKTLNRLSRRN